MIKISLNSEQVTPTGNVTSKGIINQLGRPSLDLLAVLVRETVQNSWDARASDQEPVHFSIDGWMLQQVQMNFLKETIFAERPPSASLPLADTLFSDEPVCVLAISDRGTKGLGGPTRADIVTDSEEPRDFVDFLHNIGQPPDKQLAGGTYGYGKAALYRASRARTICIYTRCQVKNGQETRFIVSALGNPYTADYRYTGRHWWGRMDDDFAEPLLNAEADFAAENLGMQKFTGNECGTTILILQPILSEKDDPQSDPNNTSGRTPQQAFNLMAEYILLYFWPKMLSHDRRFPDMFFRLSWEGQEVSMPHPADFRPLQGYVQAMNRLKQSSDDSNSPFRFADEKIFSPRYAQFLGQLILQQFQTAPAEYLDTGDTSPFLGLTHHTALMRQPELVVKYLPGIPLPNEQFGYAGVFITDISVDPVFAESEPPTHDDWIAKSLEEKRHKAYVNVALSEIAKKMDAFAKPPAAKTNSSELTPLGAFATQLGSSLIPVEQGPAATFRPFTISPIQPPRPQVIDRLNSSPSPETRQNAHGSAENNSDPLFPSIEHLSFSQPEHSSSNSSPNGTAHHFSGVGTNYPPFAEPPKYEPTAAPSPKSQPILGKAQVKHIGDSYVLADGQPAIRFELSIVHAGNSSGTEVQAAAQAVLDGGQIEHEPPVGSSAAKVMYWVAPDGTVFAGSSEIFIAQEQHGNWSVIISLPDDMMISVEFKAEARALQ